MGAVVLKCEFVASNPIPAQVMDDIDMYSLVCNHMTLHHQRNCGCIVTLYNYRIKYRPAKVTRHFAKSQCFLATSIVGLIFCLASATGTG